jgi:hypothetical protein
MSWVFVFGSNLEGVHGKGSALVAKQKYGAKQGVGKGPQGTAYAIPTKRTWKDKVGLPLPEIKGYVEEFLVYAKEHPELKFEVVAIGTGNAGYAADEIAPMFAGATSNVQLPAVFKQYLMG